MPNYVHVLFQPTGDCDLARILHGWKSYSAKEANRLANRSGAFWEREYFDHIVRNRAEFDRIVRYILANPGRAGLRDWPWMGSAI